ncbi:Drebrin-like protein [Ceratocystis fimbriata CBS 114723]|uniref:Drebrin-like protein n=1 Tax=Ceratocystis fimbriata CBS 114723 TaxID=1035309 RepID=A0A2C5WVT0_9PEZI|nr:Drebrin-like protein [Ceratocystis fimbriata CBS 114723]
MASLNLSANGPSIRSSYNAVLNAKLSSNSATFAHWALFSVQAPLANAFQDTGNKESLLKVEGSDEGELDELIQDFNEGRIQFAFVKVKDPNSTLPKCVLIGWCGGGVPERTKGYFTSHLAAVAKVLHGYHVQITARSDADLTPESIIQKVSDASGAKYAGASAPAPSQPRPPVASKPVFTPTAMSAASRVNPIVAARSRNNGATDEDGWGEDAPPVTRSEIQKVQSAYQPTKVNIAELTKQKQTSHFEQNIVEASPDVVRGGYQPVGKVDIAAIRAQARNKEDLRPTPVKGAYEPVGKVDIAAIRARAKPQEDAPPRQQQSAGNDEPQERPLSLSERSAAFTQPSQSGRMTSLPKPKVTKTISPSFTGTKAPLPGAFGASAAAPVVPPVGAASRTFADQGGKTPAQIWAEKKGKVPAAAPATAPSIASAPITAQKSGNEWKSGYTGKSWSVNAPTYSRALSPNATGNVDEPGQAQPQQESESISAASARDRFKEAQPIGFGAPRPPAVPQDSAPPPVPTATRPSEPAGGYALPGLPTRSAPPSAPEIEPEPEREPSPVRVPVAVARSPSPPPAPAAPVRAQSPMRAPALPPVAAAAGAAAVGGAVGAAIAVSSATKEEEQEATPASAPAAGGVTAIAQYDYERAEDNELELKEGENVYNIEMVDEDWWFGFTANGESGLFPSNYVTLVDGDEADEQQQEAPAAPPAPPAAPEPEPEAPPAAGGDEGQTAVAQYDYEAAEDNEVSFPEGATVTNIEFPDEDWWFGHYNGKSGLFPANYVELR